MGNAYLLAAILTAAVASVTAVLSWRAERSVRPLDTASATAKEVPLPINAQSILATELLREQWKSVAEQQREVFVSFEPSLEKMREAMASAIAAWKLTA